MIARTIFYLLVFGFVLSLPSIVWGKDVSPKCDNANNRTVCVVELPSVLSMADNYEPFFKTLRGLKQDDHILIRLSGFGGNAYFMMKMGSAMRSSKGVVTIEVTGPVMSAHAFMALAADRLLIRDYTYFMFHRLRTYDSTGTTLVTAEEMCEGAKNMDRCIGNTEAMLNANHRILLNNGLEEILTAEEMRLFLEGYDVYILGSDLKERLKR